MANIETLLKSEVEVEREFGGNAVIGVRVVVSVEIDEYSQAPVFKYYERVSDDFYDVDEIRERGLARFATRLRDALFRPEDTLDDPEAR